MSLNETLENLLGENYNIRPTIEFNLLNIHDQTFQNNISIQTPTLSNSYTLTLPDSDGNQNQVLTTDGNGVLSWSDRNLGNSDITSVKFLTDDNNFSLVSSGAAEIFYFRW